MAFRGQEIISLQFGHYSNFVGTHWWNLQEASFNYSIEDKSDIYHDVLFREGLTNQGEVTFTPRLVLADLKGSLGTLSVDGGLYEIPQEPQHNLALWDQDKINLEVATPLEKNEFLTDLHNHESQMNITDGMNLKKHYKLENSVKVWSDYSRILYHPRTVAIINDYQHEDFDRPFSCYGLGSLLWENRNYQEDYTERVRLYMEESDNLQGFHVLLDGHDGFSGLACRCLEYINDEYSSKPVLSFVTLPSCYPSLTAAHNSKRLANIALTFSSLQEVSSLFCPISTVKEGWKQPEQMQSYPYLNYDADLHYHSSAVLSAGLETLTLAYRRKNSSFRLSDMISSLRVVGRAAAAASITLPFPMVANHSLLKTLEGWNGPLFNSISPYCDLNEKIDFQSIAIRGISKNRLIGEIPRDADLSNPAYSCRSVEEMLRIFISFASYPSPTTYVCSSETPLKTNDPFPSIFNENLVSSCGDIYEFEPHELSRADQVPALGGLHSSSVIGKMLESLHTEAKRINYRSFPGLSDARIEYLDWGEKLEQLLCLSECYHENN